MSKKKRFFVVHLVYDGPEGKESYLLVNNEAFCLDSYTWYESDGPDYPDWGDYGSSYCEYVEVTVEGCKLKDIPDGAIVEESGFYYYDLTDSDAEHLSILHRVAYLYFDLDTYYCMGSLTKVQRTHT